MGVRGRARAARIAISVAHGGADQHEIRNVHAGKQQDKARESQ
jgi:hypothetical protein